jgi:hypothetical protein
VDAESDIQLALAILRFLTEHAPQVIAAFQAGEADQLDWSQLLPRRREELEREAS